MSQRNRDKIKSLFVRPDGTSKLKMPKETFSVKAGKFGEGSNTLSGIAETLGVSLKSLEKENPQIKNLNKISAGQSINVPLRKQSFVEKFILGEKTKPATRRVKTESGKEKTLAVKKGAEGPVYRGMSKADMAEIQMRERGGTNIKVKDIPADLMQQYRENFYDKGRDDTMSLAEYVQSGRAARDLKKKKGGMKAGKKHIMDLPTNVPRLQAGAILGDLDKDGKLSGYEKVRQAAIEKNMSARKNKKKPAKARDGNVRLSDQDKSLIAGYKDKLADARMSDQDKKMAQQLMSAYNARMSDQDKKMVMRRLGNLFKPKKDIQDRNK